jgi:glycine dehydrogenase subunit 1
VTGDEDPELSLLELSASCAADTACIVVQSPDFFGRIISPKELSALAVKAHACGALLVVVANPVPLGILVPPGELGADVVVGEGQALGNALAFGGPYLGYFAFRREHIRRSSGRIAGETMDRAGTRGYVFTLSTREQHIRREKATSNICTNQSLNALAAAVFMVSLGPRGLSRVAELCWQKAHYAADRIARLPGYAVGKADFFHEFVVTCPLPVEETNRRLFDDHGIIGGLDLGSEFAGREKQMLVCCTEMNGRAEIDGLVHALKEAGNA